ncbi:hypothetical protein [Streptomyces capoamus]|uniref:hypothetical protein n=1 Tax=Streptomyces capoamus TaxID=68183 RepID=UPI001672A27E|nr:hypothetical protein [Streptomyces capoamus]
MERVDGLLTGDRLASAALLGGPAATHVYRLVLDQLAELSPVVQARPPTAALVELKGALG